MCVAFVFHVCLFVLVCLICDRLCERLQLYVARLRSILHVFVDCTFVLFSCYWLALRLYATFACDCSCGCLCFYCKVAFQITRVCRLNVFCFRVVGSCVCAWLFILHVNVYCSLQLSF